ncbi:hypothetical protein L207DRAFT_627500 [Hyaloscypha variabilis F]|uniref:Zona occludens toxin N-terminal domain-containing protein n=1 Tax=Hyaloscypha variabilis (strain UAMH 11265 / GT02V1 / F) TaxID=1149755 RepID=A0A2J6SDI2_HYAVF|nr:hypothetical protein L207DRAFT_627500 [Hyaloscypha variabilis F]
MGSVHLESWVKQQYKEIGFGKGGDGPFIGKAALKQKLISRYPMHKERIRQLVNAIKHQDIPRRSIPVVQKVEISSQTEKIPQYPATPLSLESKIIAHSSAQTQLKQAQTTVESKISAASELDSDSGFASDSEDAENTKNISKPINTPKMKFQSHSPRSEDGGATLQAFPSTISRSGRIPETSQDLGTIAKSPSNPKILELKKFLGQVEASDATPQSKTQDGLSILNFQLGLLNFSSVTDESREDSSIGGVKNAVIFSADLLGCPGSENDLPQYGLLGSSDPNSSTTIMDSRLFLNTNVPFSAFVCGVQGSGKSHTTACIIENCLIPSPVLGSLAKPLSALVFNFAEYTSGSSFRPCELAFLASPGSQSPTHLRVKQVSVLVSPSNYMSLKALYTQIPGVTVQPFMLRPEDLNISTMLTLMSVNQTQTTPLYMGIVTKILRNMASKTTESFNYREFRRQLDDAGLDKKQEEFLNQRLDLLESFLDLEGSTRSPSFAAGEITIIDLSCPFMDASTACVLFRIGMGLYLESDSAVGKVIVLDEAHKYMTDTVASKALTESLMGVIRQQRHYGARVIISTQEPSISPKLIDLCSITVMHRFSSPEWLDVLQRHILVSDKEGDRDNKVGLLREIMRLRTGEALVFAPSSVFGASDDAGRRSISADVLLKMRMRKRVTWDSGRSIICI